ncbi:ATPase, T2SS/T4P/T4SS family [Burkholderia glumae]|uniref:ATPase, T2SS/T4P/T4SS family n=1 Tax=Burkholderia glumae TaxID=337 RepID=UPI00214A062A|nr:ATPase, T2SS/T4P/T4SS family [Burkholderia glumae]MCR1769765.1 Flp pilus assembly complex ATPase component TadA [Burkholderia glumae]
MNLPISSRFPLVSRASRQARADKSTAAVPPSPPASLQPYVTLAQDGGRWRIRVAQSHEFDSGFLSWIDTLNHEGVAHDVVCVDLEDLLAQRRPQTALDAAVVPRVREILNFLQLVFAVGASDVHWQLTRDALLTQLRIDGHLHDAAAWTKTQLDGQEVLRATMSLAHNKPAEYRAWEFQGAQIDGRVIPDTVIDNIRVFRGPADPITFGGEFMKLRLQTPDLSIEDRRRAGIDPAAAAKLLGLREPLRPSERNAIVRRGRTNAAQDDQCDSGSAARSRFDIAIDALAGFDETQVALAVRILAGKGLAVSTGPTGAGKTTLLHHAMTYLAEMAPSRHQVSLEDPPEKPLPWAVTLAVSPAHPFAELQKHTLRMDLDLVQMGEISDAHTTHAAMNAARSGRLTLATMHTDEPYEIFERMHGFDFERLAPRITCNHRLVTGIFGTRLFPLLCANCRVSLAKAGTGALPSYLRDDLATWGSLAHVALKGPGCPSCQGTGRAGRLSIIEVVQTSSALMADIRDLPLEAAMRRHRCRPGSDRALIDRAVEHVLDGRIDPFELQNHLRLDRREDVYGPEDTR